MLALVFQKLSLIVLFENPKRLPILGLRLRIQRWIQVAVNVGKEVSSDVLLTVTKSGMLKLGIDTGAKRPSIRHGFVDGEYVGIGFSFEMDVRPIGLKHLLLGFLGHCGGGRIIGTCLNVDRSPLDVLKISNPALSSGFGDQSLPRIHCSIRVYKGEAVGSA